MTKFLARKNNVRVHSVCVIHVMAGLKFLDGLMYGLSKSCKLISEKLKQPQPLFHIY